MVDVKGWRVVVTGGAGFLGSHLADRLINDGADVIVFDNFLTGDKSNISHLMDTPNFRLIEQDVTSFLAVDGPVDAVLHFASPASPIDYLELPIQTLKVGSLGTHNALGLAKAKQARFMLASTSEVYGDPTVHPQPESYWGNVNPIGPRGVYDEAKRFAESITFAYHHTHQVAVKVARIFNTYGPRMRMHDGRAVPTFIRQALDNEPLTIAGDGEQTRSLCYVDDLIEGLMRLLVSPHTGPINIGSPFEVSINELADRVVTTAGSRAPTVTIDRPVDDPQIRRPDTTKAKELLGWDALTSLDEGLEKTIGWYRQYR